MFYTLNAYNTQAIAVWASNKADVDRYVDWLNRDRDVNLYSAMPVDEDQQSEYESRSDFLSMDEPYWDDFMSDE